jgi:hypothetical protein
MLRHRHSTYFQYTFLFVFVLLFFISTNLYAQGVTTGSMSGLVTDDKEEALVGANVVVVHDPTGTRYGAAVRDGGMFDIYNMKIGGPYTVTASFVGYREQVEKNVYISIGQTVRVDFILVEEALSTDAIQVIAQTDEVLNAARTGAATYVRPEQVDQLPSIKRSTRDLTRLDPRSDGNYSFGGRNWLYNNISVDGSYFNNSFGLDDPAPGGQANAEPIPFDAVEQVQVSVVPYDVREGGFTGAGINTVTKSGDNMFRGSLYGYFRNESLLGNKVSGQEVIADPQLDFMQSGFRVSGPIINNKLFFFINGEIERREDPGTNYVASRGGVTGFGISRVTAENMDLIRTRMRDVYGYDTGPYDNYIHKTDNDKLLIKLDWNISEDHKASFRYNYLSAYRDLPPHPFVLSFGGTGRGPNENSLPFQNSGYRINNELNSYALELNSRFGSIANRLFVSYNRMRDNRDPFSEDFATIEIGEDGITYTTAGHEPFSIHNILDSDIWQITDNVSFFTGNHVVTVGGSFETFKFFNAFNIFRFGLFQLDAAWAGFLGGSTFSSLDQFFDQTDPNSPNFLDFRDPDSPYTNTDPYKGEDIEVGQISLYAQDEFKVASNFNLTYGLRVDIPTYITEPVDNQWSRDLLALDENGNPETVDQSKLPDATMLWSPRVGFNWDVYRDRSAQLRGGTGIFTGRLPFVWIGNVISNPGQNPNLPAHLRSFDLNAMVDDFKWPQVWTTNLAWDQQLPWLNLLGTLEFVYAKDINAIYIRNADLVNPQSTLSDGRPYYGPTPKLNDPDVHAGGIYVIDNTSDGYNYNFTLALRKNFDFGLSGFFSYTYLIAKSVMKSTEIASVLWAENPVLGNPNRPDIGWSEFGNRNRFVLGGNYRWTYGDNWGTSIGVVCEIAEGNRFLGKGGNRYSFIYSGDVNGDATASNDLIYIPKDQSDITFDPYTYDDDEGNPVTVTEDEQWRAWSTFVEQDDYLKNNKGKIADRFGALNPWYVNVDLRVLQDIVFGAPGSEHRFQLSLDFLNVLNLLNSDWGVRSVANSAATSPLELVRRDANDEPVFNYKAVASETYTDDVSEFSRWRIQVGLRYLFN